jgi:hypothetical protein
MRFLAPVDRQAVHMLRQLINAIPSYTRAAGLTRTDGIVSDLEIQRAIPEGRHAIIIYVREV